ncbi:MAG: DUF4162 domain-containing protein, partial [Candidatus Krumholzibacteriota bacterium]|nr:DUF4162 domain-containing protein [Candidatus Krumholzibacteriota bacterium]
NIIASGTLKDLRSIMGERDILRFTGNFDSGAITEPLTKLDGVEIVHMTEVSLTLTVANASSRLSDIFQTLGGAGAEIRETTVTQPSLESLFIKLTGKELRE